MSNFENRFDNPGFIVAKNAINIQRFIDSLSYKEGWDFSIFAQAGWHKGLSIKITAPDTTVEKGSGMTVLLLVDHQFQIPYFPMDDEKLERWFFDNILLVERHEAMENFKINGKPIFFPEHGEGSDPYRIERKYV